MGSSQLPEQVTVPSQDAATAPPGLPLAGSAYATLAGFPRGTSVAEARQALIRRLAMVTRADQVRLWLSRPGHPGVLRVAFTWPSEPAAEELDAVEELDAIAIRRHTRAQANALLEDDGGVHTAVTIGSRRRVTRRHRRELADTANCLMLLRHREELQNELHHQVGYTARLAGEVLDSSRRLAGVRDLERRRVAAEILSFSRDRLSPLQRGIEQLTPASDVAGQVGQLRSQLERLTADFRALARGIHPRVLHHRGVRAALTEVAAAYSQRVRITGTIPARIDQEVSASLYYLAAGCLHALARTGADVEIFLGHRFAEQRAAGLEVTVLAWTDLSEARVRAALAVDADRLGNLGGRVQVTAGRNRIRVDAWVPDRLEPTSRAALVAVGSVHTRARAQALSLAAWYAEAPGSTRIRRLLNWLDEPVHLALLGLPEAGRRAQRIAETVRRRPDLLSMPVAGIAFAPGTAGEPVIGTFDLDPDVIVHPCPQAPERFFEVRLTGAGLLRADCPWQELPEVLTSEVVAYAALLRARTALTAMQQLVRVTPPPGRHPGLLLQDLQEARSGAANLADLTALEERARQGQAAHQGRPVTTLVTTE